MPVELVGELALELAPLLGRELDGAAEVIADDHGARIGEIDGRAAPLGAAQSDDVLLGDLGGRLFHYALDVSRSRILASPNDGEAIRP